MVRLTIQSLVKQEMWLLPAPRTKSHRIPSHPEDNTDNLLHIVENFVSVFAHHVFDFGRGTSERMWERARERAGILDG